MKNILTLLLVTAFYHFALGQVTENVTFTSGTLTLHGTLTIPTGTAPFPVVIMIHGSGPSDRDQTIVLTGGNAFCLYPGIYNDTIRNFKDMAERFADHGIATLRYDKRTYTYSTQLDPTTITPLDFVDDVHAAVDFVKTRPEVDNSAIMLLGHSQGGNFLPMVAAQRNDISALLALGTVATGIDSILAVQFRELYYYCLNDTATGDAFYAQTLSDFQQIRNGTWNNNTPYLGAYPKFWRDWIDMTDSAVINFNAVDVPSLFLQGMNDFNVPVAEAQRYEMELTRDSFDIYYLNGINHYFTPANNPTVPDMVVDTIIYWLENNNIILSSEVVRPQDVRLFEVIYGSTFLTLNLLTDERVEYMNMYDNQGKLVKRINVNGKGSYKINKREYAVGIYYIHAVAGNSEIAEKILIY